MKFNFRLILLIASLLLWTHSSNATVVSFTDKSSWLAALGATSLGPVGDFPFDSDHIALANELSAPPAVNDLLGLALTFPGSATALPADFSVLVGPPEETVDPARELIFVSSGLGVATFVSAEHDWEVVFPAGSDVFALGITVSGGGVFNDGLLFLDESGTNLAIFEPNADPFFAGIISDVPIARFSYEDTNISGGRVISELSLAVSPNDSTTTVSEPAAAAIYAFSLFGLVFARRRRWRPPPPL